MCIRKIGICAFVAWIFALGNGCKKSEPREPQAGGAPKNAVPNEPAATVHWMGMKRLATQTNAARFLKFWRLSPTERLNAQTLDNPAHVPWRRPSAHREPPLPKDATLARANQPTSLAR